MKDIFGRGEELDEDIRKVLSDKMDLATTFRNKWGAVLTVIVELFADRLTDYATNGNIEKVKTLSKRISLFCATFLEI